MKDRLEKLEKQATGKKAGPLWFVVRYDGEPELSIAELERKKAEYKRRHPDWASKPFNVIDTASSFKAWKA